MPQVIEWKNPAENALVWRYPDENITWGAQLIVHEYEVAVFFRDGKAYDVFGPGRHTLTTLNLPLLTGILSRIAGFGEKPFKATVIFVSTKVNAGKYGTRAQTTELAPLQVYGSFWFKVENPQLFVMEVVGGQNAYSTEQVDNYLRGFINEKIIDELSRYDLLTVFTRLDETSVLVKNAILESFRRIGLDLTDLRFEGIDTTSEYRERLFWLRTGRATPEEVLRMETVKKAAEELGKSPGAGLGTGMVLIPQVMTPSGPAQAPAAALIICPKCSARIPATSKFCPDCGTEIAQPEATKKCSKCGHPVLATAKFCPECGAKIE
ncbi:MAG: SPFH domain-containing protein [Candidatus Bathyarchaeia archaeon]|jgi:membrane protease subunit (stomatin/prohibitin family)|nr:SPFH domain-containing protein [Candidatus Bathyarchaeota archaeon A05DMB-4]MDH7595028.1 SPFH domain-containing protein [Candidatus Bathyarchaeota archaeon]